MKDWWDGESQKTPVVSEYDNTKETIIKLVQTEMGSTSQNKIASWKKSNRIEEEKLKGGTGKKIIEGEQRSGVRRNGLVNLTNTCYLNAILQCMARCQRIQFELNSKDAYTMDENRISKLLREQLNEIVRTDKDEPHSPVALL